MTDTSFVQLCKETIRDYVNKHLDKTDTVIGLDDVCIVCQCKVLQNWKALVTTTLCDCVYFEITHNGDKNKTYVDLMLIRNGKILL